MKREWTYLKYSPVGHLKTHIRTNKELNEDIVSFRVQDRNFMFYDSGKDSWIFMDTYDKKEAYRQRILAAGYYQILGEKYDMYDPQSIISIPITPFADKEAYYEAEDPDVIYLADVKRSAPDFLMDHVFDEMRLFDLMGKKITPREAEAVTDTKSLCEYFDMKMEEKELLDVVNKDFMTFQNKAELLQYLKDNLDDDEAFAFGDAFTVGDSEPIPYENVNPDTVPEQDYYVSEEDNGVFTGSLEYYFEKRILGCDIPELVLPMAVVYINNTISYKSVEKIGTCEILLAQLKINDDPAVREYAAEIEKKFDGYYCPSDLKQMKKLREQDLNQVTNAKEYRYLQEHYPNYVQKSQGAYTTGKRKKTKKYLALKKLVESQGYILKDDA